MVLSELSKIISEELINISEDVRRGIPTAVFGVTLGEKARISAVFDRLCYIAPDLVSARQMAQELECLSGKKFAVLPPKNEVLLSKSAINKDILHERIFALHKIYNKGYNICTTLEAIMQFAPKKVDFITLKKGEEIAIGELVEKLVYMGYKRVEFVSEVGEFAIRGDILDIFPINTGVSFRVDFFYDEVEKIVEFDFENAEKGQDISEIEIVQVYDFNPNIENTDKIYEKTTQSANSHTITASKHKLLNYACELIDNFKISNYDRVNALMPLMESVGFLGDFLKDFVICYDEPKIISERTDGLLKEHNERFVNLYRNGEVFDFAITQLKLKEQVFSCLNSYKTIALQNLASRVDFYNPLKIYRLRSSIVANYSLRPEALYEDCKDWVKCGYRVLLCAGDGLRAGKLSDRFAEKGLYSKIIDKIEQLEGLCICLDYLGKGFVEHDNKLVVIGTTEMFAVGVKQKKLKSKKYTPFTAPQVGDYAVHEVYGIGKVVGTKRIATTEGIKDYLEVEYKDADKLYVPVEQMDRLSKYLGGDEPKLNKIGGEFERIKERVMQSISQMSINLKKLYKQRKEKIGFEFSPDNEFSEEFDKAFEFEPTEDQITAIAEVKSDMESTKVMDRLICGDVGFGKTEVAMRACFKAYLDGKQVAVVAPTTILSQQHYNTFKKRFEGFGAKIEVLNRFKTLAQKKKILEKTVNGDIDILIGTHSLFGKEVKFKDLGLLILDEEQRFGVEHKEKIKTLKENVDTITLTATPIPRTLHMSLVGIRDISEINTPPSQRIPTQTYVVEQSDAIIVDAVRREFDREGQVFILYNKVESIDFFAEYVKKLVPEAKILVAHGQMPERELEDKIVSFYNGEYNLLIATTIIENGIDLPNANTIIVIDADKLGLSTLYQLRGRVGRGNRMAYAYFTYRQAVLFDAAYKRLNALMEYSEIGSGYKIALRDLEIRGAGNVLGKEQHGHMEKIGYELYSKLLKEKLTQDEFERECELDCKVSAYLPDNYVEYPSARMDCYKKIAQIKNLQEKNDLAKQLESVFGAIPLEVQNLINIAYMKVLCKSVGIVKAEVSKGRARLELSSLECLKNEKLIGSLNQNSATVALTVTDKPVLIFDKPVLSGEDRLMQVIEFLQ